MYKTPGLMEDSEYLQTVLNHLAIQKMGPHNTHESQAYKFHYIGCIMDEATKAAAKADDGGKTFIKKYVRLILLEKDLSLS